jgi:hypothetical protein
METKKALDMLGHYSSLFFHTVPRTVQALVITYDEIFQALAIEGNFLHQKPFLDLGFDGVVRWKTPASEMFFSVCQTCERPKGPVWA